MKMKKILLLISVVAFLLLGLVGCRKPYDTPEYVEASPSQIMFLVPLEGDSTQQGSTNSEEYLRQNLVQSKRVQIPHRWNQTGRYSWQGEWIPTVAALILETKPEAREWTPDTSTGTAAVNQGIETESQDSIGFVVGVTIAAQIDNEEMGIKFLNRYNNKTLKSIMDNEIRSRVESKFNEECSKRTLEKVMSEKTDILQAVRDDVIPFFQDRGITITTIGLKGQFAYVDEEIQKSINAKFTAEKQEQAQEAINRMNEAKALTDKLVVETQKSIMKEKIELMELENQREWINKWDGKLPQTMLSSGDDTAMMMEIPSH